MNSNKIINNFSIFEEIWHAISHGVGLFLSTFGFGVLFTLALSSDNSTKIITSIVFGIGLVVMYGSSTLYHAILHYKSKLLLQTFDHASIYILIAATYTPVVLLGIGGALGWGLLGASWSMAAVGIYMKFAYPGKFELFSLILYAVMGWLIIFFYQPLVAQSGWLVFSLLLAGGIVYTSGIYFYAKDSNKLYHAIWHLFVLGGSVFHFFAVFLLIK
ncbi:PAQR family membrane homeostasis protein TrhA [Sulfurimonas sp.]